MSFACFFLLFPIFFEGLLAVFVKSQRDLTTFRFPSFFYLLFQIIFPLVRSRFGKIVFSPLFGVGQYSLSVLQIIFFVIYVWVFEFVCLIICSYLFRVVFSPLLDMSQYLFAISSVVFSASGSS